MLISVPFALSFAIFAGLHVLLPRRFRTAFLLAGSLVFYGLLSPRFLLLLIVQISVAYAFARGMSGAAGPQRKRLFLLSSALVLAPLVVFKVLPFLIRAVGLAGLALGAGRRFSIASLLLPVGISFYTLKSLSYLIDVYRGRLEAEKDPVSLGLAVAFFPQILAGPIERPADFLPQAKASRPGDIEGLAAGLKLIVLGIFKKAVIADQLARYTTPLFARPGDFADLGLVFGLVGYSFQIYADFSGYSDLVIGLARILGFRSPVNFRFPYFSRNLSEFWSRWHITLSTWLRDYLFLPISYAVSRRIKTERILGLKSDLFIYACGIGATMLLCGLWHGAGWTFLLWGGLHGAFMIVSRLTQKARARALRRARISRSSPLVHAARRLFTFGLVSLAWLPFNSPSIGRAWEYLRSISWRWPARGIGQLRLCAVLLACFLLIEAVSFRREGRVSRRRIPWLLELAGYALALALIIILAADTGNEFLYLRF
jgi:D-alanyl-lipoteichoic acid acyltransferase DltB (MBOAT superfamily)